MPSSILKSTRTAARRWAGGAVLLLAALLATRAAAQDHAYPAGANVVNLALPPYNLVGDGATDNSAALQAAFDAYIRTGRILYLPNGTYLISQPLYWRPDVNSYDAAAFLMLHGQSRAGAIIRLRDNAPGFQDPAQPRALLRTAPLANGAHFNADSEQGFRNSLRDLTFDTGTGNPGAIGLQFYANNQGMAERLNVVSGDGQGPIGLDLSFFGGDGPAMLRDIHVQGFDFGVKLVSGLMINIENLAVENQRAYGVWSRNGRMALRGFTSTNAVPAVRLDNGDSPNPLVLLDATLTGTGAASGRAAIETNGYLYARNVTTGGYAQGIAAGNGHNAPPGLIAEYTWIGSTYSKLFPPSPDRSLGLPVKDVPEVPWDNPATEWANVVDYGADATGNADATAAVQAAVDAGKPTVYFPNGGRFRFDGTVLLRGAVRRVLGNECRVYGTGGFRLVAGAAPAVVFEQFFEEFNNSVHLEQASGRTLAVNSILGLRYDLNGPGDVFLTDITTRYIYPNTAGASIWARQFNVEYGTVENKGAKLWVLGMKTEAESTWINTTAGGSTEVLGCLVYASGGQPVVPMFVNNESNVSLVGLVELTFNKFYPAWVREIRGGVTRELTSGDAYGRGLALAYSGFNPAAPLPVVLTRFEARRTGPRAAELSWATATETNNAGFEVQASADGLAFARRATVAGAPGGNSASPRTYQYLDDHPANTGVRYYRLAQLDLGNGPVTYSPVRAVDFAAPLAAGAAAPPLAATAVPNPAGLAAALLVEASAAGPVQLRVLDALGRVRLRTALAATAGANRWPLPLAGLAPGVYVLEVELNGRVSRQRLVRE